MLTCSQYLLTSSLSGHNGDVRFAERTKRENDEVAEVALADLLALSKVRTCALVLACVRACVRACVDVRMCVCVCVSLSVCVFGMEERQ